ncbi:MAG: PPC domain-containing DNA-binding protein [Gemmataceae bacterium]
MKRLLLPALLTAFAAGWLAARPPAESAVGPSPVVGYAVRLKPGQDLKQELLAFARRHDLKAAAVVTGVGSLTDVALRYANKPDAAKLRGHFEIVSLVGTLDPAGGHLHLSVSDGEGRTVGGHLLDGCVVYTTAEVVIAELTGLTFGREVDPTFGYKELTVRKRER